MTPERWQHVKDTFHAALGRAPNERSSFLDEACRGDDSLRQEIESLIRASEETGKLIDAPAYEALAELAADGQQLAAGETIGHHSIISALGRGGMGEVYLAEDPRLRRNVALKLLPAYFAKDAARLRRFEQEARAASALNHPNILTIYEIGETESTRFIVTEFIDGLTLRQRMAQSPLDLDEALDIAIHVASALVAAHRVKIVHRDIKPENIMVRRDDGLVKVLDFGLAKATEKPGSGVSDREAPTRAIINTAPGVVMGTVAYMSPEQARGLAVDERTDIWSIGVVLYEMIAGKVPFAGTGANEIISAILSKEQPAPLTRFAHDLPAELDRIVTKALAKDREERYQTTKDLFIDLKRLRRQLEVDAEIERNLAPEARTGAASATVSGQAAAASTQEAASQTATASVGHSTNSAEYIVTEIKRHKGGVLLALAVLFIAGAGVAYFSRLLTKPGPTQPVLTAIPLTTDPGYEGMPSLSPDGNYVAFGSFGEKLDNLDIYVKLIGGGPPIRLTSDPAVDEFPAWSPDGRSIAFIRERDDKDEVILIPALGGPERKLAQIDAIADLSLYAPSLSWSPDGKYLVTVDRASPAEPAGLFVLSLATGEKRRLTTPPAPALADYAPAVSPDGRMLAFVRQISGGNSQLYVLPLSEDCRPTGEARPLDLPQPWVESPAWTADGREIICDAGVSWLGGTLWRVSVSGSEKPLSLASLGEIVNHQPTISRQGNRLVYNVWGQSMANHIWRAEVSGRDRSRPAVNLITSTRDEINPQYSPDGSLIAFHSDRSGNSEIWVCNSDGSNPVQLTSLKSSSGTPRWFPDGKRIVFDSVNEKQIDIFVIDTDTRVPRRLTNDPSDDGAASVSHDGKWIYFSSRRTGRWEVWRLPAEGGEAVQVTREGGAVPFESPDGKAIYYEKTLDDSDVWKVPVTGGEETRVLGPAGAQQFAVVADGIYFIEPGPPGFAGWMGNSLRFFSFAKGTVAEIFDIKYRPMNGLSVSPDGRYVLFTLSNQFGQDLMLVENFH